MSIREKMKFNMFYNKLKRMNKDLNFATLDNTLISSVNASLGSNEEWLVKVMRVPK